MPLTEDSEAGAISELIESIGAGWAYRLRRSSGALHAAFPRGRCGLVYTLGERSSRHIPWCSALARACTFDPH